MKIFRFMVVALVAMCGFASCSEDCDHDFIEIDYNKELVGIWTCLEENYAEALVIKDDGSIVSTCLEDGEYWEGVKGTWKVSNNKITMFFEDDDNFNGSFDLIPGETLSLVDGTTGERTTYYYCEEDLSEAIVGMWVCNDGPMEGKDNMGIHTYKEDGTFIVTTNTSDGNILLNQESTYKVVGDLLFYKISGAAEAGVSPYACVWLTYVPDGSVLGGMLYTESYQPMNGNGDVDWVVHSWLSIKQELNLADNKYAYSDVYVSNVKGLDQNIDFMGDVFNFSKIDGASLDKKLKLTFFTVEFPAADTIMYSCRYSNDAVASVKAPIVVDGNKMTIKMSKVYPSCKDVDLYTFQDYDDCQLHMYMPTYAFINFFGNMQVTMMAQMGQLNLTDAAAVKTVFDGIDTVVETINVSFVMRSAK